jgi:hypothetical protein
MSTNWLNDLNKNAVLFNELQRRQQESFKELLKPLFYVETFRQQMYELFKQYETVERMANDLRPLVEPLSRFLPQFEVAHIDFPDIGDESPELRAKDSIGFIRYLRPLSEPEKMARKSNVHGI